MLFDSPVTIHGFSTFISTSKHLCLQKGTLTGPATWSIVRYQLGCIRRNLYYIKAYTALYGIDDLLRIEQERLSTIKLLYTQQKVMLDNKTHMVADRIVSLSQPWIRPIVRGKSKAPTEFGAKISISVVNGYTFVDRLSFDAYNEGEAGEFERVVEE